MQANINLTPQLIKQMKQMDSLKQAQASQQSGLASQAVTRLPSLFATNICGTLSWVNNGAQ